MRLAWPKRLSRSLYARVAGIIFFLILLTSLIQLLILVEAVGTLGKEAEQTTNWGVAQVVADKIQPSLSPRLDRMATMRTLFELQQLNPGLLFFILDSGGEIVLHFPETHKIRGNAASVEILEGVLRSDSPELPVLGANPVDSRTKKTLFSVARVELNGEPAYVYVVFTSLSSRILAQRGQFLLTRIAAISFVIVAVTAIVIGAALFYLTTRRYRALIGVLQDFENGDFSKRIDTSHQDEVSEVGQAINSLADSVVAGQAALEKRDAMRRHLLADISHDLRTPVSALQLRVDVLNEASESNAFFALNQQTPAILRSLNALQRLVTDLFELTKMEIAPTLRRETILIEHFLKELVEQLTPVAEAVEVTLRLESIKVNSDYQIQLDPDLVERLLTNLIENALRYSPKHSTVTIRTTIGECLRIEVQDEGTGIDTEIADSLFARGKQSAGSAGAGLGLAICRTIAELHGGTLSYIPAATKGAIFRFDMPLQTGVG